MSFITPILSTLFNVLSSQEKILSKETGISVSSIQHLSSVLQGYMSKDEKLLKLEQEFMNKARQHDMQTYTAGHNFVNGIRSLVRPICTFVSLAWYVYARMNDIELMSEDYAIIGGVLAFWFGFRPFDKK